VTSILTGLIANLLVLAFLALLATKLNTAPLWIVIFGGVVLMVADFVGTIRGGEG